MRKFDYRVPYATIAREQGSTEATKLQPAWTYTLRDIGGSLWGILVFSVALLSPGYLVARALDIYGFRSKGLIEQLAWSVVVSFGAGTLPIVALVWITGVAATGYLLLALALLAIVVFLRTRVVLDLDFRLLTLAAAFTALVLLSLVDIGYGQHLWMSVTSYDHGIRTAFIDAVLHTGVVPANPLYWPGHAAPMRYYYFWYVTCAVVARLAHIGARQALIAGCVWPFFGVLAMLALFARHLLGWQGTRLRRGWWLAVALLGVTGLDLLATIGARLGGDPLYGDMDWWSIDQVSSWADSFLWVPHHVAALVGCLLTLLLLWAALTSHPQQRIRLCVLAGLSFAGATGLSTYVALATAVILTLWLLWRLSHGDYRRTPMAIVAAALTATALLLPYLWQLLHRAPGEAALSRRALVVSVREIISPDTLTGLPGISALHAAHPFAATQLAALLLLVPGYIAELGFFLVALLVLQCSRELRLARTDAESTLLVWTWSGLIAATLVRSQIIATNDYGIRAMLLPQFFLLLIGGIVLQGSFGWLRKALIALAVLGVLGTAYQLVMLRLFLPWHEQRNDNAAMALSERNYALRDAYSALDKVVPAATRIQYNPAPSGYLVASEMLNIHRQIITADSTCASSFGGDPSACTPIERAAAQLYEVPAPTASVATSLCAQLGAQYLVADRWDTVWSEPSSWVWSLPVMVDRPSVRVVQCSPSPR